jgi:hypothetical protein
MPDPGTWLATAAGELSTLGFTLINADRPSAAEGSQLLVALRDRPTLRHFDPELITCWVAQAGRGHPLTIDRAAPAGDRDIAWGHVHVVDRLEVENRFLTFGGPVRIADAAAGLRAVQHTSPGPIVRWGGHSQGSDALAGEIGAFFGRIIVRVDYPPGGEARIAAEPPASLYAAFLADRSRHLGSASSTEGDPLSGWIRGEASRIRSRDPDCWAAGGRLLQELDLDH